MLEFVAVPQTRVSSSSPLVYPLRTRAAARGDTAIDAQGRPFLGGLLYAQVHAMIR